MGFVPYKGSDKEPAKYASTKPSKMLDFEVEDLANYGFETHSRGLSGGAIAGIAIAIVLVVGASVVLVLKYGLGIFMLALNHEIEVLPHYEM